MNYKTISNLFPTNSLIAALKLLSLCLLLSLFTEKAVASHIVGAEMYYDCLGSNQYRVYLVIYRDCNGLTLGSTQSVSINSCGTPSGSSLSLQGGYPQDKSPICSSANSVCTGGGAPGIDKWLYQGIVTLPAGCNNIKISFSSCCWSGAITTLLNPSANNIFTEILIDNTLSSCNSSPRFKNEPLFYTCRNQQMFNSYNAQDVNGDSLSYVLVNCQTSSGNSVTYGAGYSGVNPFSSAGISINPATGAISSTPTTLQNSVICVRVDEYRNGVKIGEQTRVTQLNIQNCTNNTPLASPTTLVNFTQNACVGASPVCFDVIAYLPGTDSVFLSWDNSIPGASLTQQRISEDSILATFCWTPSTAGTRYFTMTANNNACPVIGKNTFTFTLNAGNQNLPISVQNDIVSCFGSNDGVLNAIANGTAPYAFIWNIGATTDNLSGLSPGIYSVSAVDANGCSGNYAASVLQPSAVTATISSQTNVSCNGQFNGSATVAGNGGAGAYSYLWSNGRTTNISTGMVSMTYSATVTDLNGCYDIAYVTITQPTALTVSIPSQTNITCFGGTDGGATAMALGGTAPYAYAWGTSPMQNMPTVVGIPIGAYCLTVTDMNGCTATNCITLTQPSAFTASVSSQSNPTCNGTADAAMTIIPNGGTSPYLFIWSNGQSTGTNTMTGLSAGVHCVTVMDANNCTAQTCATITQPSAISISFISQTNVSCFGGNNGAVTAVASNGAGAYIYLWNNGNAIPNPTGLPAGQHCVTVVDANGCMADACVTISEPSAIILSASVVQMSCALNDGQVSATVSGGAGLYTFYWSGTGGFNSNTATNSGLLAGTYSLTVTDLNGCTATVAPQVINAVNLTFGNGSYIVAPDSILDFSVQVPAGSLSHYILQNPIHGTIQQQFGGDYIYTPSSPAELYDTTVIRVCDGTDAIETTVIIGIAGCVWAGDTDTNQLVNNFDLLPIGQHYGLAGNSRPNAGIDWDCEPMTNWTAVSGAPNPKHSDTNGDGFIDDNDTLAITQNWGQLYLRSQFTTQGGVPIYVDTASTVPGDTLSLSIILGTGSQPAAGVYGVAFTVEYDNTLIDSNTVAIGFVGSWLGNKGVDMITIFKDFYNIGEVEIGIVRTDHNSRTNSGAIGQIVFTIKDDVLKRANRRLDFMIKDIRMIDSLGNEIPVSPEPSSVLIQTPSAVDQLSDAVDFNLFPNPANEMIRLQLPANEDQFIRLYDSRGALLQSLQLNGKSSHELDLRKMPSGNYFLQLQTDRGVVTKKFVKI